MSQVEVLNATYVPLGKTRVGRAVSMVLSGYAVVEKEDPFTVIRSKDIELQKPLVIRLLQFIKVPVIYAEALWTKEGVLKRDNYICGYCGEQFNDKSKINVDHVIPRSQGGQNTWLNTICACLICNCKKANRTPQQANMPLFFEPTLVMKTYYASGKRHKEKN